jgi:hypothetical protein
MLPERRYYVFPHGDRWVVSYVGTVVAYAKDQREAKRAAVNFAQRHIPSSVSIIGVDGRIVDRYRYGDLDDTIIS